MSLIPSILKRAAEGTLTIGSREVKALQVYVRNNGRKGDPRPRAEIEQTLDAIQQTPWPITPDLAAEWGKFVKDTLYRKDGKWRDTPQTRRFGTRERAVVDDRTHAEFVCMKFDIDGYWSRMRPGYEPAKDVYPVWRVVSKSMGSINYIYVPWQNSVDPDLTGFFFV